MDVDLEKKDLLFCGSIPGDTAEDVMLWQNDTGLAAHAPCLPDGEVGDRSYWITGQAYRVFNGHPDIETLQYPDRIEGVESWKPRHGLSDQWSFRVKSGVDKVVFGDRGWRLGYATAALGSYYVFKTLRAQGQLSADLRFQICLPMPFSTVSVMFRDEPEDVYKVVYGYADALMAEVETICAKIPHHDLAIQWDSTGDYGALADPPVGLFGGELDHGLRQVVVDTIAMSARIPEDVWLGYHLCYGSLTGWFMARPKDLSLVVNGINTTQQAAGRKVDFAHFPILDHRDAAYYAPLKDLQQSARYYLGVVHNMDDEADYFSRLEQTSSYIAHFGIAAPCGFGRWNQERLPAIAAEHQKALRLLRQFRG